MRKQFEIIYCQEKNNPEWDAFISNNDGDIAQTSAWANYDFQCKGWQNTRFFVTSGETIVAGCQINIISDYLFGTIGLIQYGPCFKIKTPEIMNLVVTELKNCVKTLNLTYLMVLTDYREHDFTPYLENEKFEPKLINLPPYRITTIKDHTLFLNLSPSTDELLKQMKSRRRGIQIGLNSPFKVKLGERDDLKAFYDLYDGTVSRHPYTDPATDITVEWYPMVDSYEELCRIWDELSPYGWVKLFLGTVENEVICGGLTLTFGKVFRGYHWGWNGKYVEYHVSEVINWEMNQWAKTNGFSYFDFCEIDIDVARAFLSPGPIPEEIKKIHFYGPTMFKLQFGGNIVSYPVPYVFYSEKMKHLIGTSEEDLAALLKLYKNFYWPAKRFFRRAKLILPY